MPPLDAGMQATLHRLSIAGFCACSGELTCALEMQPEEISMHHRCSTINWSQDAVMHVLRWLQGKPSGCSAPMKTIQAMPWLGPIWRPWPICPGTPLQWQGLALAAQAQPHQPPADLLPAPVQGHSNSAIPHRCWLAWMQPPTATC